MPTIEKKRGGKMYPRMPSIYGWMWKKLKRIGPVGWKGGWTHFIENTVSQYFPYFLSFRPSLPNVYDHDRAPQGAHRPQDQVLYSGRALHSPGRTHGAPSASSCPRGGEAEGEEGHEGRRTRGGA